jgi:PPOX class probable F420-dependent enzyme
MLRLTPKHVRLLSAPNFATVATVMRDGSPEATVVWMETDGTYVYFNTAMHRLKARNIERDPRVAITVFDPAHPYRDALAIRGRAEMTTTDANEHAHKLSRAYTSRPFRKLAPGEVRVIVKVTPERSHLQ